MTVSRYVLDRLKNHLRTVLKGTLAVPSPASSLPRSSLVYRPALSSATWEKDIGQGGNLFKLTVKLLRTWRAATPAVTVSSMTAALAEGETSEI